MTTARKILEKYRTQVISCPVTQKKDSNNCPCEANTTKALFSLHRLIRQEVEKELIYNQKGIIIGGMSKALFAIDRIFEGDK